MIDRLTLTTGFVLQMYIYIIYIYIIVPSLLENSCSVWWIYNSNVENNVYNTTKIVYAYVRNNNIKLTLLLATKDQ